MKSSEREADETKDVDCVRSANRADRNARDGRVRRLDNWSGC